MRAYGAAAKRQTSPSGFAGIGPVGSRLPGFFFWMWCIRRRTRLRRATQVGVRLGVALHPRLDLDAVDFAALRACCDTVVVMSVEPGRAGQQLLPGSVERVGVGARAER